MASINPVPTAKKQPCYLLRWLDPHTRKGKKLTLYMSKERAEQERKRKDLEISYYKLNPNKLSRPFLTTLEEAIRLFLENKKHTIASTTYQRYEFGLHYVKEVLGSEFLLNDLKIHHIDKIIKYCKDVPLKDETTNTSLRHFRVLLNWAYAREMIERVPPIKLLKTQKKEIRRLSDTELKELIENCPDKLADLVKLYVLTGARRNELLFAEWKDIKLTEKRIYLADPKSKKREYLVLNNEAVRILEKYRDNDPRPFNYTESQLRWMLGKACEKAKLSYTTHDLRRTAGAILLRSSQDIFAVKKFLRHSSVKVTEEHYVDILPSELDTATEGIKIPT